MEKKFLEELSRVDTWATSQFRLKSLAVKEFVMRHYYDSSSQDAPHPGYSSLIILRYTSHNASLTLHPSLGCPSNHAQTNALPLNYSSDAQTNVLPHSSYSASAPPRVSGATNSALCRSLLAMKRKRPLVP